MPIFSRTRCDGTFSGNVSPMMRVKGRDGGQNGAAGSVELDDGTKLKAKGWQHVPPVAG